MVKEIALIVIIINFLYMAMLTAFYRASLGRDKLFWGLLGYLGILAVVIIWGLSFIF